MMLPWSNFRFLRKQISVHKMISMSVLAQNRSKIVHTFLTYTSCLLKFALFNGISYILIEIQLRTVGNTMFRNERNP